MSDIGSREENAQSAIGPAMPWTVRRVTAEGWELEPLQVVLEEPLVIQVNEDEVAALMRLPGYEKELAVGYCLSEGLIRDFRAIYLVHHCGRGLPAPDDESDETALLSRNRVQIRVMPEAYQQGHRPEILRLVRSGCAAAGADIESLELPPVSSHLHVEAGVLLSLNAKMRQNQKLFRDIGAVHAAALFDGSGELVTIQEDIGRHNAVDKVIGYCLLRDIPLEDKIIVTTGRASYEMVSKALHVGLPIVASVSSPTALAVQLAERYGCTLIGYMRGNRFSIYTHPWRVLGAGQEEG